VQASDDIANLSDGAAGAARNNEEDGGALLQRLQLEMTRLNLELNNVRASPWTV